MNVAEIAEIDKINEIKDAIADAVKPKQIYLFGSFAKGTQTKDSDYDMLIIVDDSNTELLKLTTRAYSATNRLGHRPRDFIVRRNSDFEENKTIYGGIEYEVAKDGVLIYGQQ